MTKEEFMEKFGDGNTKIRRFQWNSEDWVIPKLFGLYNFSGKDNQNEVLALCFDENWELYKEPKPEFDFDKPYMWIRSLSGGDYLCIKTSFMTWSTIFDDGNYDMSYTKKEITRMFVPSIRPNDWKDYISEEKDLI